MFTVRLNNRFGNDMSQTLSSHRTLDAAIRAAEKEMRSWRRVLAAASHRRNEYHVVTVHDAEGDVVEFNASMEP